MEQAVSASAGEGDGVGIGVGSISVVVFVVLVGWWTGIFVGFLGFGVEVWVLLEEEVVVVGNEIEESGRVDGLVSLYKIWGCEGGLEGGEDNGQ